MGDIECRTRWAAAFEVQVVAKDIIDWVYGLQVLPLNGDGNSIFEDEALYGFRGSTSIGLHFSSCGAPPLLYDGGHMAVTYSALAILRILGDDFSSVARKSVLKSVQALQQIDGRLEQSN
jgi:geranylgeranyl transferase type-1 subunit beta